MSPEQFRGDVHFIDGRSDIWSLGVILYQLLTGRLPFQSGTVWEVSEQVLHRDPRPPRQISDEVSPAVERVCLKCLEKDVRNRYATAADLAAELRTSIHAPPRPRPSARVLGLSLAGLAGIAIVSATLWWLLREPTMHPFDAKSGKPAIKVAAELGLKTANEPDVHAAIEEIAKVGWGSAPEVADSLGYATEDLVESIRYAAVSHIARWYDADAQHPADERLLEKLSRLVDRKDARGRPYETSERVRDLAGQVLRRFPYEPKPVSAPHAPTQAAEPSTTPSAEVAAPSPSTEQPPAPRADGVEDLFQEPK
jgi:hypothetical protein